MIVRFIINRPKRGYVQVARQSERVGLMPEVTFVSQGERECRATQSRKALGRRSHSKVDKVL